MKPKSLTNCGEKNETSNYPVQGAGYACTIGELNQVNIVYS